MYVFIATKIKVDSIDGYPTGTKYEVFESKEKAIKWIGEDTFSSSVEKKKVK